MNFKIGEFKEEITQGSVLWIATNLQVLKLNNCMCQECALVGEFFTGAISLKIIDFFTVETMQKIEDNKITVFINDEHFILKAIVEIKNLQNREISFLIHDLKLETI
jgi:hypothetical protein